MNLIFKFRVKHLLILILFMSGFYGCKNDRKEPQSNPQTTDTTGTRITSWLTSPGEELYLEKQEKPVYFTESTSNYPTISIDTTQMFQTVDGFGFALTGGSAFLINNLPAPQREELLKELFTTENDGIGVSYLRISIGASDLDASVFTYNDIPVNQTDEDLSEFSIEPDTRHLIPVLKSVIALNPAIKIMGSPWSAPSWMKTGKDSKGGSLRPEYYAVYADYFVKYILAMQAQGIVIDAITPQNEPLNPHNNPSMLMSAGEQAVFIKNHLGPAFKKAGINTKIVIYDHNCDVPSYPVSILDDQAARQYIDGSAFHLYAGDISALSQVHDAHPDKNLYFTEQWVGGPGNFAGDFSWHVKNLIIGAMRNRSRNVIEWNLASDPEYKPHTPGGCTNCMGALTIGSSVKRNVSYYIIAHASKFVPSGSVRIASGNLTALPNVSYQTPEGKKVLIVLNDSMVKQTFKIRYRGKSAVTSLAPGAAGTYIW